MYRAGMIWIKKGRIQSGVPELPDVTTFDAVTEMNWVRVCNHRKTWQKSGIMKSDRIILFLK